MEDSHENTLIVLVGKNIHTILSMTSFKSIMASEEALVNTAHRKPLNINTVIIISIAYSPKQINSIILFPLKAYNMPRSVLDRVSTAAHVHKSLRRPMLIMA